jgi:hypothetical protein
LKAIFTSLPKFACTIHEKAVRAVPPWIGSEFHFTASRGIINMGVKTIDRFMAPATARDAPPVLRRQDGSDALIRSQITRPPGG